MIMSALSNLQHLSTKLQQEERETEHTGCSATNFLSLCQAKLPNLKGFGVRPYGPSGLAMSEKAALNSFQFIIMSGCILNGLAPFHQSLVLPSSEYCQQTLRSALSPLTCYDTNFPDTFTWTLGLSYLDRHCQAPLAEARRSSWLPRQPINNMETRP